MTPTSKDFSLLFWSAGPFTAGKSGSRGGGGARAGDSPLGLDLLPLLVEVVEQAVVKAVEQVARELSHACEDVPGASTILAALQPGPKLTCRAKHQGVHKESHLRNSPRINWSGSIKAL